MHGERRGQALRDGGEWCRLERAAKDLPKAHCKRVGCSSRLR
jgi:hypothetical protein